ncbi:hypothetical protein [Propionicimonas paludicola]|uniref:hypothetical protein n=1 Tax=Propionicimonas paludicola TaxID=185243 RepID=UPI000BFA515E|nr:hypothetical protein [Propionicimonas paludicola]
MTTWTIPTEAHQQCSEDRPRLRELLRRLFARRTGEQLPQRLLNDVDPNRPSAAPRPDLDPRMRPWLY